MHGPVAGPMVEQALKRSVLGGFPRDLLDQLLGTAMRLDVLLAATSTVRATHLALRVFLQGADGR